MLCVAVVHASLELLQLLTTVSMMRMPQIVVFTVFAKEIYGRLLSVSVALIVAIIALRMQQMLQLLSLIQK
jgi:uncharacterized membrane protein YfbV (UPF0208 family)